MSNELKRDQSIHHKGENFEHGSHKTAVIFVNMVDEKWRVLSHYFFLNKLNMRNTDVLLTGCSVVTQRRKRKPVPAEYMKAMRMADRASFYFLRGAW